MFDLSGEEEGGQIFYLLRKQKPRMMEISQVDATPLKKSFPG